MKPPDIHSASHSMLQRKTINKGSSTCQSNGHLGPHIPCLLHLGFPGGQVVKNLPAMQETRVHSLSGEDLLEEGMTTDSSILSWEPWLKWPSRSPTFYTLSSGKPSTASQSPVLSFFLALLSDFLLGPPELLLFSEVSLLKLCLSTVFHW